MSTLSSEIFAKGYRALNDRKRVEIIKILGIKDNGMRYSEIQQYLQRIFSEKRIKDISKDLKILKEGGIIYQTESDEYRGKNVYKLTRNIGLGFYEFLNEMGMDPISTPGLLFQDYISFGDSCKKEILLEEFERKNQIFLKKRRFPPKNEYELNLSSFQLTSYLDHFFSYLTLEDSNRIDINIFFKHYFHSPTPSSGILQDLNRLKRTDIDLIRNKFRFLILHILIQLKDIAIKLQTADVIKQLDRKLEYFNDDRNIREKINPTKGH